MCSHCVRAARGGSFTHGHREQKLLLEHDILLLQYPFYWYSSHSMIWRRYCWKESDRGQIRNGIWVGTPHIAGRSSDSGMAASDASFYDTVTHV
ncbi:MAG: hypothetical protein WBD30_07040 [Bacteroidota bacterium]